MHAEVRGELFGTSYHSEFHLDSVPLTVGSGPLWTVPYQILVTQNVADRVGGIGHVPGIIDGESRAAGLLAQLFQKFGSGRFLGRHEVVVIDTDGVNTHVRFSNQGFNLR